ncbi:MAG TPA: hypothetical protein VNA69_08615 [Thermoanaerobaculia bacterium]|nr:hypothetical protein [Thermoanaerobaculia bacterium]
MSRSSRRHFAKLVVVWSAATPVAAVLRDPTAATGVAALHTDVVKREFGQHLTEADLAALAKQLQERAAQIETLRRFKLQNSDEPDVTFSAGTRRW